MARPGSRSSMQTAEQGPELLEVYEIAHAIGWERRRALRLFQELGIVEKLGARWVVAKDNIRDRCPTVYRILLKKIETGERPPRQSGRPPRARAATGGAGGHASPP